MVHPVLPAGDLPDDLTETLVGIADVYEEDMLARVVAVAQVRVHEERLTRARRPQKEGVVVIDMAPVTCQALHIDVDRNIP